MFGILAEGPVRPPRGWLEGLHCGLNLKLLLFSILNWKQWHLRQDALVRLHGEAQRLLGRDNLYRFESAARSKHHALRPSTSHARASIPRSSAIDLLPL